MERASRGLTCQLALVPLFRRHRILAQVAGHELPVIKLLPPLVLCEDDLAWIEAAFQDVVCDRDRRAARHHLPAPPFRRDRPSGPRTGPRRVGPAARRPPEDRTGLRVAAHAGAP